MNTPVLHRFVLICLLLAFPIIVSATEGKRTAIVEWDGEGDFAIDSIARRQVQKPEDKKPDDHRPEQERPDVIKEVPKSIRRPRPREVIDRVRIKRPPMRPGGLGRGRLGM